MLTYAVVRQGWQPQDASLDMLRNTLNLLFAPQALIMARSILLRLYLGSIKALLRLF